LITTKLKILISKHVTNTICKHEINKSGGHELFQPNKYLVPACPQEEVKKMKQRLLNMLKLELMAISLWFVYTAAFGSTLIAAEEKQAQKYQPVVPAAADKCAVCGMFVAKYPGWIAEIIFRDGSATFFDGPKDLFTCYFNIKKYLPQKSREEIAVLYVTAYYSGKFINAAEAFYVLGSDILGPMGNELIPCRDLAEAKELMKDHRGNKILSFKQLSPGLFEAGE
jgi:nitrous oxide reductase accessory protein NosL